MTWKFWKWDITGAKRIAALEKRLAKIEAEVMPHEGGLWAYMINNAFFGPSEQECKPVKLTLRDKVNRICDHLKITFEKQDAQYVLKTVKKYKG